MKLTKKQLKALINEEKNLALNEIVPLDAAAKLTPADIVFLKEFIEEFKYYFTTVEILDRAIRDAGGDQLPQESEIQETYNENTKSKIK